MTADNAAGRLHLGMQRFLAAYGAEAPPAEEEDDQDEGDDLPLGSWQRLSDTAGAKP